MTNFPSRVYRALKLAGHPPAKATEIILDAKRGDTQAIQWIKAIKALVKP